jgi:hypothetical protein
VPVSWPLGPNGKLLLPQRQEQLQPPSYLINNNLQFSLCVSLYVFCTKLVKTVTTHAHTTVTKDARSSRLFIQHLKQLEPPRSIDESGGLHVVELFSLIAL